MEPYSFTSPHSLALSYEKEGFLIGLGEFALPFTNTPPMPPIVLPSNFLAVLKIVEHEGDPQGGIYKSIHTTSYNGWYEVNVLPYDIELLLRGKRRVGQDTDTRISGTLRELGFLIGTGETATYHETGPAIMTYSLLLTAVFR